MHLPLDESPPDSLAQRRTDSGRTWRAFNASLAFVLAMLAMFSAQHYFDWRPLAVSPGSLEGLWGLLFAPLLHGSPEHVGANAISILILGTLAGMVYPRASIRALPLLWLGSGLGAWLLGEAGSVHLGASGVTHGLGFMLFALGVLRRDRAAIAVGMIAFMFYGGMILTVLPREPGISWQAHLGGALAGLLAAWLFRRSDPQPPRKRYSWEIEEEIAAEQARREAAQFELSVADDVPVLWQRDEQEERGTVLPFRRPRDRLH
ncbi:MAG: rhomboid family intramembrane serine protease [Pseudomonadota bacterium]|nr:rhomboid family intramembrane serine protease [Pseudomonadota bacterium]